MTAAIETSDLSKYYGSVHALRNLDLEVRVGEVFGFLGPNGAGKTTTIRLLLDLIKPTSGTARVLGKDTRRDAVAIRRRIGYLPAEMALDPQLTGGELFAYYGAMHGGVDGPWRDRLIERLGFDPSRRLKALSTGNKKKAGIVQAFMHRPDLLILDEPTSGLDPLVQHAFLDLVREVVDDGATVFLSSHVLAEVEDAADRVGILRSGQLATVDSVSALTERAVRHVLLRFAEPVPEEAFTDLDGVGQVTVDGTLVDAVVTGSPDRLVKAAARYELVDLSPRDTDLEQVFLAYYRQA